jgi:hypothetical protein
MEVHVFHLSLVKERWLPTHTSSASFCDSTSQCNFVSAHFSHPSISTASVSPSARHVEFDRIKGPGLSLAEVGSPVRRCRSCGICRN